MARFPHLSPRSELVGRRSGLIGPRSGRSLLANLSLTLSLTLSLLAGCAFGPPTDSDGGGPPRLPQPSTSASPEDETPSVIATVLAKRLEVPWGIAFLPDGGALVTERNKRAILKVGPASGPDGLQVTELQTITEAKSDGESGLLGIAVSPDYAKDHTVFIYYSTATDNRIAKLKLGGRPVPILSGIPHGSVHNGGQLRFGPDDYLYASTGDASRTDTPQDLKSLGGKILRMTKDGRPAPGNPYPQSVVWSSGHRDVQGLAWDAGKHLFATELGQNSWDELNVIEPGKNYGWPTVEGIAGDSRFVDPVQQWAPQDASCAGVAVVGHTVVTACLRGARLWLIRLTSSGKILGAPSATFVGTYGRLRSAVAAPDGSVWVTTSNLDGAGTPRDGDDKILRIVVSGSSGIGKT